MITADTLLRALRQIEQNIHRDGWNQPALLGEIIELASGRIEFRVAVESVAGAPGETLLAMATAMAERPELAQRIAQATPELIALAFCHESWVISSSTPGGSRTVNASTQYGDTVGAVPMRSLCAVDISGRLFHVYRERGSEPLAGDVEMKMLGGKIGFALANLVSSVSEYLPNGDPAALLELRKRMISAPAVTGDPPTADF